MKARTNKTTKILTATETALKAARETVNTFAFGTPEWESGMVTVRELANKANNEAPKVPHSSIDGDIFA